MKKGIIIVYLCIISFFINCDGQVYDTIDIEEKEFDTKLHGKWTSNDPTIYSGTLEIDFYSIIIKGYGENQTPSSGNDSNRPFRKFTKNIPLKGYSEEGKFFIEDNGFLQDGIPYTYWEVDNSVPPDYKITKFISFTFSDRIEKLQNN